MKPHWRVLAFCVSLLLSPGLWALGDWLGSTLGALALAGLPVAATALYASLASEDPFGGGKLPRDSQPS